MGLWSGILPPLTDLDTCEPQRLKRCNERSFQAVMTYRNYRDEILGQLLRSSAPTLKYIEQKISP